MRGLKGNNYFKSYFNGSQLNTESYVKINLVMFSQNLDLIKYWTQTGFE